MATKTKAPVLGSLKELEQYAAEICPEVGFGEEAVKQLEKAILRNEALQRVAFRSLADETVRRLRRGARSFASRPEMTGEEEAPERNGKAPRGRDEGEQRPKRFERIFQEQLEKESKKYLHFWTLMDGTPLGKATKEHLLRDADRFRANALGNFRSANFLVLLASDMEEGQMVEEAYSEDDVAERMRRAEREQAG